VNVARGADHGGITRRPADRVPVDATIASRPPDAITAHGELVSNVEIEAAEELSRLLRRVGAPEARVDGFAAYRAFRRVTAARIRMRRRRLP
jgi:hypothetical protein